MLVLDIDMPKLNGLQVSAWLQSQGMAVKIVILSIYDEPSIVRAALKQGARGYVLKNRAASDLVKAIQAVNEGEDTSAHHCLNLSAATARCSRMLSLHTSDHWRSVLCEAATKLFPFHIRHFSYQW